MSTTPEITLSADDATAHALVAVIRSAVRGGSKYGEYVAAHDVTRENVKHHAAALAALAYPNEKPVQTKDGVRTIYGNAVQAAGAGLRANLPEAEKAPTDWLRLVRQAAENAANKGGFSADEILANVASALKGTESDAAA